MIPDLQLALEEEAHAGGKQYKFELCIKRLNDVPRNLLNITSLFFSCSVRPSSVCSIQYLQESLHRIPSECVHDNHVSMKSMVVGWLMALIEVLSSTTSGAVPLTK